MGLTVPEFHIVALDEQHAAQICSWCYEPPYDIYSWLPWEQMQAIGFEFGDTDLRTQQYVSVVDEHNLLCGFAQLFPLEGVTRLGIGMRPDLCGHGLGISFVGSIVAEAQRRAPGNIIDLEVLTWNGRAIAAYQKSGFTITDRYERRTPEGIQTFYCMIYGYDGYPNLQ